MNQDIDAGYTCPCCGQFVKRYCRKINTSMALTLIAIYQSKKRDFFHVENWLEQINRPSLRADYHKLRFWGLLEKKVAQREDGSNRNGYYKITERGLMFAENKLYVPEKALILNNKLHSLEGKEITIVDALKDKFNYSELMNIIPAGAKTDKEAKEKTKIIQSNLFY
jgi:hypothetical protein